MTFDFKSFGTTPDTVAKPTGREFNLSSFGTSAPKIVNPQDNVTKGDVGTVGNFLGIEKFGRGIGQAIANTSGVQDKLIALHDQSLAIQNQLVDKIKQNKAVGKDTTKLRSALDAQIKSNADFINTISDVGTGGLTNKEVIGSAISTASLFLPGSLTKTGAGTTVGEYALNKLGDTGVKALLGGATGYAMDVGNNLQDNKSTNEALEPGWGTVIGISLPLLTSIFGKGAKIEQINERLTPTEKKTLGKKGKDVAQYLVDNRVVGTPEQRLSKVNTMYNTMEDKIQTVVDASNTTYSKQPIIEKLLQVKDKFLNDPAEYKGVSNRIDEVINFLKEHAQDIISTGQLNKYKRSLANSAYNEKGSKVVSEGLKQASDTLYSFLQEAIPQLKSLNTEYGKIITARNLLSAAATRSQIGLMEKGAAFLAGGGIGSALGGGVLGGSGGAFLGPKVANVVATPIRSVGGMALNEVNKLLTKIPVDKVGNLQLTRKALIKLLTQ